ncbi:MAG: hypothetical protein LBG27_12030 [Spirochaetaceae bacterium]|nr:hypothetical protein [Spirochaetaceae bacterium]
MANHYIPSREAAFDPWFNNLVEYVLARVLAGTPVWTHIPAAEAEALANAYTAWHTAPTFPRKSRTPRLTRRRKTTRKRRR